MMTILYWLLMKKIEELVLIVTTEKSEALLDCACPTTVTGKKWMEAFFLGLREKDQREVKVIPSENIYKFGGGILQAKM